MTWREVVPFVPRVLLERDAGAPREWASDSTVIFIDISGFTTLSEQLARRGRVGAEDLVSTLTRIFTLLMSATDDGGDVVKFAGDALLVEFHGDDHVLRACHSAAVVQRLLDVVGSVRLAGARARLRMSVGVHTGSFDFMLTGEAQQNLVVAGPALDHLLLLQDTASAGEILISDETAARLPAHVVGARKEPGVLLRRVPTVTSGATPWPVPTDPDALGRLLPAVFTTRPDLLTADSDHRHVAVGFAQVSGLAPLLRSGEALSAVDRLTGSVEAACADNGVTLLDADMARGGFRYFLTAGAPEATEDAEGRLLRALLDITRHDGPLAVRAGASAGQVFAGPVGAPFRRTFSVMGDPTNLAARLTARAPQGSVLAHRQTLLRALTTFATQPHDAVTVKGKQHPIEVDVVDQVVGRRGRVDPRPRFVGRAAELRVVADALQGAMAGVGSVVGVVGEAGAGKSRLVQEALDAAPVRQVRVSGDPFAVDVPGRILGDVFRPLLGVAPGAPVPAAARARLESEVAGHDPELASWLPLLNDFLAVGFVSTTAVTELDARFREARLHETCRRVLEVLVREPTGFVLEDVQWFDDTSTQALAYAFADIATQPWAVLTTGRESGLPVVAPEGPGLVHLPALEPDAARELVVTATHDTLRPAEVEAILGRSSGNPYFMLELAAAPSAAAEMPSSVEELVALRMDRIEASDRDLLRQASVLGTRFPESLCTRITGATSPDGLRREGLRQFLDVASDGLVAFRREVYREVAYQQLTFGRRRDLHRRVAQAIANEPDLAGGAPTPLLSLHSHAAGAWADAYRWSREAAHAAREQQANGEAVTFCERAIDAGRRSGVGRPALSDLQQLLGDVLTLAGRHQDAVRAFTTARRGLSEPADVVPITYRIGMVHREASAFPAALRSARQVRTLARTLPAQERRGWLAEADLLAAGVQLWQGHAVRCRELSLAAAGHADGLPQGSDRTRLLARAYSLHDSAATSLEGRAGDYGEAPLAMFEEIGDLYHQGRFCVNVAIGYYYDGHWDRAVEMYHQSQRLAEQIGDVFSVAVAQLNIGELLAYQGKPAEAIPMLRTALSTLRALRTPFAAAHAATYLGVALVADGDLDESARSYQEAESLFGDAGLTEGHGLDEVTTRRAELELRRGRPDDVAAHTEGLLARSHPWAAVHQVRLHRVAGAALAASRPDDALAHLESSLAHSHDIPYEEALTRLALADLTSGAESDDLRSAALHTLTGLGVRA